MPKARPCRTIRSSSSDARLRDAVVLDEELLELVDDQQRAGHGLLAAGALVAGDVLHAELAEQVAAALQFLIHALQHAQAEFAVALDGHHPRMGQAVRGVALELDALLEIHQVELHLLRAAPQGQVGDDDVEQGGFAGAGLAGDQRVLAGALADGEILQLGRAGAADRHAQFAGGVLAPDLGLRRGDVREGHFHAVGIAAALAHLVDELGGELRRRRGVEQQVGARQRLAGQQELAALPLRQTLLARSSSGMKSGGSGWRWSQWISV